MLTVDDLSPRERVVVLASCQLGQAGGSDPRKAVMYDPDYTEECEHLFELGWLERVEVEHAEERELVGYHLSQEAATAHNLQAAIDGAKEARN